MLKRHQAYQQVVQQEVQHEGQVKERESIPMPHPRNYCTEIRFDSGTLQSLFLTPSALSAET